MEYASICRHFKRLATVRWPFTSAKFEFSAVMNIMLPCRTYQLIAAIAPSAVATRAVQLAHAQFHLEPAQQYLSRVRFRRRTTFKLIGQNHYETQLPNGHRDGCFMACYTTGHPAYRRFYINDALNGVQMEWHIDGHAKKMETYVNGRLHGLMIEWWSSGRIHERCYYVDDELHGEYMCCDHNGIILEHYKFVHGLMSHCRPD